MAVTQLLIASALAAAPASPQFGSLWTGWTAVNREAVPAEMRPAPPAPAATPTAAPTAGTAELGERVGEMVRTGDCEAGERLAREAADFALVRAVRAHCRARPAGSAR